MDDIALFNKLPEAAKRLGESAKAVEDATGQIGASIATLKVAQQANLQASQSLREIMEELKRRAEKREKGGKG
jgi:Sec-independent protein translocase protein TatA